MKEKTQLDSLYFTRYFHVSFFALEWHELLTAFSMRHKSEEKFINTDVNLVQYENWTQNDGEIFRLLDGSASQ